MPLHSLKCIPHNMASMQWNVTAILNDKTASQNITLHFKNHSFQHLPITSNVYGSEFYELT